MTKTSSIWTFLSPTSFVYPWVLGDLKTVQLCYTFVVQFYELGIIFSCWHIRVVYWGIWVIFILWVDISLNGVVKWRILNIFLQQPKTSVPKIVYTNLSHKTWALLWWTKLLFIFWSQYFWTKILPKILSSTFSPKFLPSNFTIKFDPKNMLKVCS